MPTGLLKKALLTVLLSYQLKSEGQIITNYNAKNPFMTDFASIKKARQFANLDN